jgi:hypothetical protein
MIAMLCTMAQVIAEAGYSYTRPFVQSAPLWDYWPLLLLPLCAGIAIVYKAVRCTDMKRVPREATGLFVVILLVMGTTAASLVLVVKILESN